jgi:Kef-type K+ transport system membrane component KefB
MMAFIYVVTIFVSAMIFGEIATKYNQPNIIGELFGGILVGPIAVELFSLVFSPDNAFFTHWQPSIVESELGVLIDIGMVMVMLIAGLGTDLEDLIASGKYSVLPALLGVVVPMILGYGIGMFLDYSQLTSLFIGASLSITAVAVSAKTLLDLRKLQSRVGATILGAAIIDDILGLIILSLLLTAVHGEAFSSVEILIVVVKSVGFLYLSVRLGGYILPKLMRYRTRFGKELRLGMILFFMLIFAIMASICGLHEMIGAFIVGLLLKKVLTESEIDNLVTWGLGFFTPLFFGWIGFSVSFSSILTPLMGGILITAVAGKVLGCGVGALLSGLSPRESMAVGLGMNGRGAVELVLVGVGLEVGVIQQDLFSVIVFMAFFTTIITPIALKIILRSEKDKKVKGRR